MPGPGFSTLALQLCLRTMPWNILSSITREDRDLIDAQPDLCPVSINRIQSTCQLASQTDRHTDNGCTSNLVPYSNQWYP
jgi:hypothetical protein